MRRLYLILLLIATLCLSGVSGAYVQAQSDNLAGVYGTEFWLAFLSNGGYDPKTEKTFKITLYAVSETPVSLSAYQGTTKLGDFSAVTGGQQYFYKLENLSAASLCPAQDESEKKASRGICILSNDNKTKFSCYAFIEVGGKSANSMRDATLLLPKDILDKEYFVQMYPDDGKSTEFVVVATENDTKVNITPSCKTLNGADAGSTLTTTLNKGEVYMVKSQTKLNSTDVVDLSGSTVCADKPVAVFNGNEATKIPDKGAFSPSHTFEQCIPQTMWGTEFYLALAGGTLRNRVQVTASYNNTKVTYIRASGTQTVTLNRGQSFVANSTLQLNQTNSTLVITANYPILCYNYLGCGADNQEVVDVGGGDEITYEWGNPANALVVPWSHRAKEMSFYTDSIENQTDGFPRKYFVQIVTDKPDDGKIVLDGVALSSTLFKPIGTTGMVYTNVELTTHGKHRITTTGAGFTGFVHGITSEARAYQYTLGFDPPKYLDSLFIENKDNVMSPYSYDLSYMDNKGWYQRQPEDFPVEDFLKGRVDTAYVCDSTLLNFYGHLAEQNKTDEVIWKFYKCDQSGKKIMPAFKIIGSSTNGTTEHRQAHLFTVDPQLDRPADQRDKYTYYAVDMEKYKKHLICTDLPPDADTLRTMVRVHREYNDTTWRIICQSDTVHFFKECERFVENLAGDGNNKETVFKFNTQDLSQDIVKYKMGINVYSRKYLSINGCDSIVTLMLFGCDTIYHQVDTTVCQDSLFKFQIIDKDEEGHDRVRFSQAVSNFKVTSQSALLAEMQANGKLAAYTNEYLSVINRTSCLDEDNAATPEEKLIYQAFKKHCLGFKGCPDTFRLNLTIMPRLTFPLMVRQVEWCTLGDETATYAWKRPNGDLIENIKQDDPRFDESGVGKFGKIYKYDAADCPDCPPESCVMEKDTLVLHLAKDVTKTVHICRNESYKHDFGGNPSVTETYYGKNYAVGGPYSETKNITIGSGAEKCEYQSTLNIYVHPSYAGDDMKKESDITCRADGAFYTWTDHPRSGEPHRSVWMINTLTNAKQKVTTDAIPLDVAGTFTLIDSLKTKTCTECMDGACDSIWQLTLTIGAEVQKVDSFGLCQNAELDYVWNNTHYYYYSDSYKGTKKTPYTILKTSEWLNKTCKESKVYVDDHTYLGYTKYGCDSLHVLKIHLDSAYVTEVDTFICETQYYKFLDEPLQHWDYDPLGTNLHTLSKTVKTKCDCDSGVTHYVHVRPVYLDLQDEPDTTCQAASDVYTWKDHPLDGEPPRKLWMINIKTNEKKDVMSDAIPLNVAGTFTLIDSLKTQTCPKCADGCDSITSISLTVIPTHDITLPTYQLSSEKYYLWDDTLFLGSANVEVEPGITYKEKIIVPGADCYTHYQHHTTVDALGHSVGTHNTCDSIVTLCIKVGEVFRDTAYAPVCENCDYLWHIEDPSTGGEKDIYIPDTDVPKAGETRWYYDSLKTAMGFDSIHNLQLTGFPTKYKMDVPAQVCQGEDFVWAGHPGQRTELYIVKGGVATAIKTNDFIKTISQEYGQYLIRDSMITDTVFYNPGTKKKEPVHCDSIWELTLTVHPTYTWQYNYNEVLHDQSLCSNDTLLWSNRLWVGYDFDLAAHPLLPATSTTLYDSIVYIPKAANKLFYDSIVTAGTVHGCDSISYVNIHISRYDTTWLKPHIGDNDQQWSFGGKGGTFSYNGKSKITREDLVPSASVDYTDPDRSAIYKFFFIDTLQTANGCDSIVWDSVYIHPSYRFVFDTLLCSNNDWDWRPESPHAEDLKNVNLWLTGIYYDSLFTEPYHIDSVFVLDLTIQPGAKHYFGNDICKNDTLVWDHEDIYYRDNYKEIVHTYKTGSMCDSVLIFTPVFYEYYHFPTENLGLISGYSSDSICRFDELIWISPGETTPHTAALRGEKGEHFAALPTDTFDLSPTGDTIGIWITIYDSLHTTAQCHCDSTYTLRYYVKPSFRYYDTITICTTDTLEWRGQILTSELADTIHTSDSYQTVSGSCDSIYYLTLYVNQAYDSLRYDTICGNEKQFLWEGHNLTSWLRIHDLDTLPNDTSLYTRYPTEFGCDSIFRLELNVRPILTEEWTDTICVGETYTLNAKQFTVTGVYTDTLKNHFGCDSFAVVHLEVVPATKFTIEPMILCADNGAYDLVFAFDPNAGFQPREVRIVYDSLAQACGYPDDTLTLPVVGNIVAMELPKTDELYVRPNNYTAKIYFENGTCDDPEMQRVDFHFTVDYPDWILEQRWADAIGILSAKYNGDYTFSAYQWYKDGEKLVGETKPYYFAPQYLEVGAEYSVELTREGDDFGIMTCAIKAVQRDNTMTPQKPYVSVVPTYVVKANPVVHILCSQFGGDFRIYNPYGSLIEDGHFEPGEHNAQEVHLPALSGMYLFELNQENGEVRTVKVIVE